MSDQESGAEGTEGVEDFTVHISPELIERFTIESTEQIDVLEEALVEMDSGGGVTPELIAESFRSIHSFKGNAGFMGYSDLESLAHRMEDVLDGIQTGKLQATPNIITELLKGCDTLRNAIPDLEANQGAIEGLPDMLAAYDKIRDQNKGDPSVEESKGEPPPSEPVKVEATPEPAPKVEATPEPAPKIEAPEASREAQATPKEPETPAAKTVVEETSPAPAAAAPPAAPPTPPASGGPSPGDGDNGRGAGKKVSKRKTGPSASQYIRVEIEKLDLMLNQVGELISAAAAVVQHPELEGLELEKFQAAASNLTRVTAGLHDASMAMRMIPLRGTFKKIARLVRDVSHKVGKKVELEVEGEDTEVDKSVIESISDPLVHLIRNAVDHGIEAPNERAASGKSERGKIRVSARHQGGEVWIQIEDDGRGIDRERILASARKKGLIPESGVDYSDSEVFQMIFMPGFSTAAQLTDISGRGVGMDVVKRNIEALRGRVEVASEIGAGTTFTVRLPLTLAIIDAMLVRISGSLYALPLLSVRESISESESAVTVTPDGASLLRVRDNMFPILTMEEIYNLEPEESDTDAILVLVEDCGESYCLRVDELIGQRQVVIKALDSYIGSMRGISGCTVLGNGEICLIIDVGALARAYDSVSSEPGGRAANSADPEMSEVASM